jgi:F-type H+-transporting ATPase subunit delta
MSESVAAKRYANALFEVAKESKQLEKVEQDLQLIVDTIFTDQVIVNFLNHPQINAEDKRKVVGDTIGKSVTQISENLLFLLIDSHRQNELPAILSEYTKMANDDRGIIGVEVRTVDELGIQEKEKLAKALAKEFTKEIRLNNIIDPSIIGGVIVNVGDKIYDGSIRTKLNVMKRLITTSRV